MCVCVCALCVCVCVYVCVSIYMKSGFPDDASGKESTCQRRRHRRYRFNTWVENIPWRRAWQPTPVFLPGESHGHRVAKSQTRLK